MLRANTNILIFFSKSFKYSQNKYFSSTFFTEDGIDLGNSITAFQPSEKNKKIDILDLVARASKVFFSAYTQISK